MKSRHQESQFCDITSGVPLSWIHWFLAEINAFRFIRFYFSYLASVQF